MDQLGYQKTQRDTHLHSVVYCFWGRISGSSKLKSRPYRESNLLHFSYNEEEERPTWEGVVLDAATAMLSGQTGIIEGARRLAHLRNAVSTVFGPEFAIFVAIDSETDDLPVGAERVHWADWALIEKDKEIRAAEELYRDAALAGCQALISKLRTATVVLYRPVGPNELALIGASGYREFPPRLPHQPIFYPVLTEEYATKIARDWNATSARTGYRGYVTRFAVRAAYLTPYEVHDVGGSSYQEYWIRAGDLPEFNENIVGLIEVIAEFRSSQDEA